MSAVEEVAGARRIAAAFAGHGKRAALMPYLMGGYPSVEESLAAEDAFSFRCCCCCTPCCCAAAEADPIRPLG